MESSKNLYWDKTNVFILKQAWGLQEVRRTLVLSPCPGCVVTSADLRKISVLVYTLCPLLMPVNCSSFKPVTFKNQFWLCNYWAVNWPDINSLWIKFADPLFNFFRGTLWKLSLLTNKKEDVFYIVSATQLPEIPSIFYCVKGYIGFLAQIHIVNLFDFGDQNWALTNIYSHKNLFYPSEWPWLIGQTSHYSISLAFFRILLRDSAATEPEAVKF